MASLVAASPPPGLPPLRLACAMFQFPRGCPKPCGLAEAFGPLADEGAQRRLSSLQEKRDRLDKLLGADLGKPIIPRSETGVAPVSEVVECMEQYWQHLAQLTLSIEANPESVFVRKSFSVEWPSVLTRVAVKVKLNAQANSAQILGALYLEAAMLLTSRAFMLANSAVDALGVSGASDPKAAAAKLRAAAGILEKVAGKVENEWAGAMNGLVKVEQRPVETLPAVCVAFRDIFLGAAQQCAVRKQSVESHRIASASHRVSQSVSPSVKTFHHRQSNPSVATKSSFVVAFP